MSLARLLALLAIFSALAGCTTFRRVPVDQVSPGDTVRVTTVSGMRVQMKLTSVQGGVLAGESTRIAVVDVRSVEKRSFSATRTLGVSALVFLGFYVVVGTVGIVVYAVAA